MSADLTARSSPTGRLRDILTRDEDYPFLATGSWVLDDLGNALGERRAQLDTDLFLAMLYRVIAAFIEEAVLDDTATIDGRFEELARVLHHQTRSHLERMVPEDSPFWQQHARFEGEHRAALTERAGWATWSEPKAPVPPDGHGHASPHALSKIGIAAAAHICGRGDLVDPLVEMTDLVNRVHDTRADILTFRRDALAGRRSDLITRMLAGGPSQPVRPDPAALLGALVLTGVVPRACDDCHEHLADARVIAARLGLPSWLSYLSVLDDVIEDLARLFAATSPTRARSGATRNPFLAPANSLDDAVERADAYLLSDLTFRETWEIQRNTIAAGREIVGRAFPSGLVIEVLCARGHDLSCHVDGVFRIVRDSGFSYYDNLGMVPDADSLGLLLRLFAHSNQQHEHRSMLERPLGWLEASLLPSGEIPTFLRGQGVPVFDGALFGDRCLGVQVNLLLGLLAYRLEGGTRLFERTVATWLAEVARHGLSPIAFYPCSYVLWNASTLLQRLGGADASPEVAAAAAAVVDRLERAVQQGPVTPQDAAFLALACSAGPGRDLYDRRWISTLLKSQRYDGTWEPEPLFLAPTHGAQVVPYASRTLTTAFCGYALDLARRREEAASR